jgi:hypothetical protein
MKIIVGHAHDGKKQSRTNGYYESKLRRKEKDASHEVMAVMRLQLSVTKRVATAWPIPYPQVLLYATVNSRLPTP